MTLATLRHYPTLSLALRSAASRSLTVTVCRAKECGTPVPEEARAPLRGRRGMYTPVRG